jgi:cytochrome c556
MFRRTMLAALIAGAGAGAVIAQQDPVKLRESLMNENNDHAITMVKMMRGQVPFDAGKVDAAFGQWAETAKVFPTLFPDNAKTGGDNRASPKIWENKKDFEAKAAEFGKVVADNRESAKASLPALKAAIPAVGQACDNCHEDYRLSKH